MIAQIVFPECAMHTREGRFLSKDFTKIMLCKCKLQRVVMCLAQQEPGLRFRRRFGKKLCKDLLGNLDLADSRVCNSHEIERTVVRITSEQRPHHVDPTLRL